MKENIVLMSIGDCIPEGKFTEIDSIFEKVVNFVWENKVIAVCTPALRPGPYNVIVSGIGIEQIKGVETTNQGVLIYTEDSQRGILCHNGEEHKIGILCHNQELVYHSELEIKPINKRLLIGNLDYIKTELLTCFAENSLAFLLEPEPPQAIDATCGNKVKKEDSKIGILLNFEEAYRQKFIELYKELQLKRDVESVLAFHGYGYGLTPAGDDFIIGYMIGLHILSKLCKNELSKQLDSLYSGMLRNSSHRVVNTFVQMAYEGRYSEPWKFFLQALLTTDLCDHVMLLKDSLDIGATSGSDTMVGMISALVGLPNSDSADWT